MQIRHGKIDSFGPLGRQLQHCVDLAPGRVVANGNADRQVDAAVGALRAKVSNFSTNHYRIWHCDHVIFTSDNFGREHTNFAYQSLVVRYPNHVAFAQRARLDQNQSTHCVVHHPGRPQREHQAKENADTFNKRQ